MKDAHRVLAAINDYLCEHGISPTVRELCKALGWKSRRHLQLRLRWLQQNGFLKSSRGRSRALIPASNIEHALRIMRVVLHDAREADVDSVAQKHRLPASLIRQMQAVSVSCLPLPSASSEGCGKGDRASVRAQ